MKTIILLMCLIPTIAFAELQLNFKDGTKTCGNYSEKGAQYCKGMTGGEICLDKSTLKSVSKVDDCSEVITGEGDTSILKANQQDYKSVPQANPCANVGWQESIYCETALHGGSVSVELLPEKKLTREQQRGLNSPFIGRDGY